MSRLMVIVDPGKVKPLDVVETLKHLGFNKGDFAVISTRRAVWGLSEEAVQIFNLSSQ